MCFEQIFHLAVETFAGLDMLDNSWIFPNFMVLLNNIEPSECL